MAIAPHTLSAVEQENLEKAKAGYTAFQHGDMTAVLKNMADDVEWEPSAPPEIP